MRTSIFLASLSMLALPACAPKEQKTAALAPQTTAITLGSQEDLSTNVGDRVFFDFDRSNLDGKGSRTTSNRDVLARQVAWLKNFDRNNIQIAGNCDERGTEEYNLALGERRARNVKSYFVANGIGPQRITTISYGKERPVALRSDEDAWSQNRNAISSLR